MLTMLKACKPNIYVKKAKYYYLWMFSTFFFNLPANDVNITNVKEHIVQITKYFRNNYFASPKLKEEKHSKLILLQDRDGILCLTA